MKRRRTHWLLCAAVLVLGVLAASDCTGDKVTRAYRVSTVGSPARGRELIQSSGCGACHTIPGISSARGTVGPPLYFLSRRTIIAGELPNTPENLVRWVKNPVAIHPATAMPNLGLNSYQARDIAAYLYTLR